MALFFSLSLPTRNPDPGSGSGPFAGLRHPPHYGIIRAFVFIARRFSTRLASNGPYPLLWALSAVDPLDLLTFVIYNELDFYFYFYFFCPPADGEK